MRKMLFTAVLLTAGVAFASAQTTKKEKKAKSLPLETKTAANADVSATVAIPAENLLKNEDTKAAVKEETTAEVKTEAGTELKAEAVKKETR